MRRCWGWNEISDEVQTMEEIQYFSSLDKLFQEYRTYNIWMEPKKLSTRSAGWRMTDLIYTHRYYAYLYMHVCSLHTGAEAAAHFSHHDTITFNLSARGRHFAQVQEHCSYGVISAETIPVKKTLKCQDQYIRTYTNTLMDLCMKRFSFLLPVIHGQLDTLTHGRKLKRQKYCLVIIYVSLSWRNCF